MYTQLSLREKSDELHHVIPVSRYIAHIVGNNASPFKPLSFRYRILQWFLYKVFFLCEQAVGTTIYVKNTYRELILLEPRSRTLLTKLIKEGIISNWRWQSSAPDIPEVHSTNIDIAPILMPDGRKIPMGGATGNGTGSTLNESIIPALGELLERYSCTRWNEKKIHQGPYNDLYIKGAIHPSKFQFYTDTQLTKSDFKKSVVDEATTIRWVCAQEFISKKESLIPAQLAFMFYQEAFPDQPIFQETNSNAAAAGKTFPHATYNAMCEAIERDAFLLFWLNRLSPPRIDIGSIDIERIQEVHQAIKSLSIEMEVLDCTTELGVPVFVGIIIDSSNKHPLFISAAAGYDLSQSVHKLFEHTLKFLHARWHEPKKVTANKIRNINDRINFWANHDMLQEVNFLINGPVVQFSSKRKEYNFAFRNTSSYSEKLQKVLNTLRTHNFQCYVVDVTSEVARSAGLCVVRAVIPQLIPMYFNESRIPKNIKRLYTIPEQLGYKNGARNEDELNPIPHPFN